MMNSKLEKAINKQINAEIYSSYLYYSMAAFFDSLSLKGFAHWLRLQAIEEMIHAQKFITYINDRGGKVVMYAIDEPKSEWDSPLKAAEAVYEHEVYVTERIHNLMDLALAEKDHATVSFLQWFVTEQVEEEASTDEIVQQLKLVENANGGVFMVDRELGKRTIALPPEFAGTAE